MKTTIAMAREAAPKANLNEPYCLDDETRAWLERFAELARADEREACAKVCELLPPEWADQDGIAQAEKVTMLDCAAAI